MKLITLILSFGTLVMASPVTLEPRKVDYLAVINEWRVKGKLPKVAVSDSLVANARKARLASGTSLHHTLYPGISAQVALSVAAGHTLTDFPNNYVQFWLCEKPSLSYLKGVCKSPSSGGGTGHADIVTDPKYRYVGCSFGDVPNTKTGFVFCDWA